MPSPQPPTVPLSQNPGISTTSIKPDEEPESDPTFTRSNSEDFEEPAEKISGDDEEELREQGIVYHYLTFETELPTPPSICVPKEGRGPPPPKPDLVRFTSPFEWSETRKSIIVWISCGITCLTAFTAGAYSPGIGQMTEEWGVSSVAALVGITTFCCGV